MSNSLDNRLRALGARGIQSRIHDDGYCPIDGCYREAVSYGSLCSRHKQNQVRYGSPHPRAERDFVSDAAGPECRVCGRSVYSHGVTEFCELVARTG